MNKTTLTLIAKYTVYALLLLVLYVLQTTPGLFAFFGVKPMLVIPAAIVVAMHEGEFAGGLYGAFAGLLCDMSSNLLFGFNGLLIAIFCISAGLLVIYLTRCNIGGATIFVLITMTIRGGVEYIFGYGMWGYENVEKVFLFRILPTILYTTAVTAIVFVMVRGIYRHFNKILLRE